METINEKIKLRRSKTINGSNNINSKNSEKCKHYGLTKKIVNKSEKRFPLCTADGNNKFTNDENEYINNSRIDFDIS